jgi:hypothetical protein
MLVAAMALRARLAARQGEAGPAQQWARALSILWREADPERKTEVRDLLDQVGGLRN